MTPIEICKHLGTDNLDAYFGELSGKEIRAALKAGGSSVNVPTTAYTQAARRKAWRRRFEKELGDNNGQIALALLLEWLMRHHRDLLVDYLDFLGVEHTQGETDEDFCETQSEDKLREGVTELLGKHPPHHVATYLLLVGHLQESTVFDRTPELLKALGMGDAAVAEHIAAAEARDAKKAAKKAAS